MTNIYLPIELEPSWHTVLQDELSQPYMLGLAAFIAKERAASVPVYPPQDLVFNAFWHTPYHKVRVLIMGQDPYHGPGQAHGLCFSVPKGVPQPPSLQNIIKELVSDVNIGPPSHGCLLNWAKNGVMLLNATLTVRQGEPLSHHGKGWERFTDTVILKLCQRNDPLIFLLWGKSAQEKCRKMQEMSNGTRHTVLMAPHPSPLSAYQGFLGCKHFSKVNELLIQRGQPPIDWSIQ